MMGAFRWLAAVGVLWLAASASAQLPSPRSNVQLALERLANTGSVLMIGAHPDDENTSLLAYLALGRRMRTGYLSLTRGEGGQNVIGPEQGVLLGAIREQELLAARRIDGGEQYFTSALDFGYSKSADETIQKWDRHRIVGEIVQVIREFRPDMIIPCWTGTSKDGHGHHQASAILAREAFAAAADPKQYAEQSLPPWQAKQLYVFSMTEAKNALAFPVGDYEPLLGRSYTEIAGISRSQHRSQAFGTAESVGAARVFLLPEKEVTTPTESLPREVSELLTKATSDLQPKRPYEIIPILLQARGPLQNAKGALATRKLHELDEVVALCAGLDIEALTEKPYAPAGSVVQIQAQVVNRSPAAISLEGINLPGAAQIAGSALQNNTPVHRAVSWTVPSTVPAMQFHLRLDGSSISITRPLVYRYVDKILGDRQQPFRVVPRVSVSFAEGTVLFPSDAPRDVKVVIRSYSGPVKGAVSLKLPHGWSSNPESATFELARDGAESTLAMRVTPAVAKSVSDVTAVATTDAPTSSSVVVIRYPHIPTQVVVQPAKARFVRENIKVLSHKVGYVMGAGDEIPEAIRQLGCSVTLLTASDLTTGDLNDFDAIVTGVRAFNLRDDLRSNFGRLTDYVHAGGTLIVQYNLPEGLGSIGPFPITIGRDRISVEEAPVRVLNPKNPLLRYPNPISASDFEAWVQERGLYFPSKWDPKYETVIESADPGEKPLTGGILFTRYGEGAYIYTSYSWFRQLPAGVPGTYRIFANMLSQ